MAQKKKHVECVPTPRFRVGMPLAMKQRINSAVGYDMKPYREGKKRDKKKGKGIKK